MAIVKERLKIPPPYPSVQGVIYIGGACPPFSRVAERISETRLVVAADSGYDNATAHGLTVDVAIGDFDSIANLGAVPRSVRQIAFPREKNLTDTELAIDHCRDAGCSSLLLVGGGGGSIDHLLALVWLFEGPRAVACWITHDAIVDCIDAAGRAEWRRECRAQEIVSILPVGRGPWRMRSAGLHWPLDGVRWRRDSVGIRNRASGTTVTVTIERGRVLVLHGLSQEGR